jgi:hypothetical protein
MNSRAGEEMLLLAVAERDMGASARCKNATPAGCVRPSRSARPGSRWSGCWRRGPVRRMRRIHPRCHHVMAGPVLMAPGLVPLRQVSWVTAPAGRPGEATP